jgi:hypothetical protein
MSKEVIIDDTEIDVILQIEKEIQKNIRQFYLIELKKDQLKKEIENLELRRSSFVQSIKEKYKIESDEFSIDLETKKINV